MAKQIKKAYGYLLWFFAAVIASSSLTGCGMYGPPPRSYYTMNGKVIQKDGEPIQNIRITVMETNDQVATSKNGSFEIINDELMGKDSITVQAEDVDGKENGGEFTSKTIEVDDFRNREINIEMELKND
ncbi:MAG: radical SAM-associated putative lipoprotein [Bacillota bacterium]